jgi:ankyrin repeat protein
MRRLFNVFRVLIVALPVIAASTQADAADLLGAVAAGDIGQVREALKAKPDPDTRDSFGGTALHGAMFRDSIEITELLIDYGCDVNAIGPANGYTPLHDAVWANNVAGARLLIERGARLDIRAKDGLTPLEKAEKEGKTEIAALLKKAAEKT